MGLMGKPSQSQKPKLRAGLDIGSTAVRVVELADSSVKPTLKAWGLKKLDGTTKDMVAGAVKALVEEAKAISKEFVISVSGPSTIVRFITMPRMKDEELKGAVRFEAEKFIPFNINECIVDFQVLKKDERENKFEILLVAAKKAFIEDRIKVVERAGFSVSIVDVDSFALVNAFTKSLPSLDQEKTFAVVNIGSAVSNLSIVRGGLIRLVRDMAIGGNELHTAVSKSANIDIGSDEAIKGLGPEKTQLVIDCMRPVFTNLSDEMRLSLSYYENQYGRAVDEVYLSGGDCMLPGIEELFKETTGLKPVLWNPFQGIEPGGLFINKDLFEKTKGAFAVAIGLALR